MNGNHLLNRPLARRLNRRATNWIGAGPRPRPPDYLAFALRALRRVIRARRRLMKLAPELYDVAQVNRLAREREESDKLQAEMRAAIARVYGVNESGLPPSPQPAAMPRSARARRAIAAEEAEREHWLHVAREAFDLYERRRPHALPCLRKVAALLDVSSILGRLATGLETLDRPPAQTPPPNVSFQEALERVYGSGTPGPCSARNGTSHESKPVQ